MKSTSRKSEIIRSVRLKLIKFIRLLPFISRLLDSRFPFVMRSGEPDKADFYLEELVNEPDENITAAHVTAWVYQDNNKTNYLALAGHANAPICKQVSAGLFNALLECPDDLMKDALLVPGAFLLPAYKKTGQKVSSFSVDKLINEQLMPLQDATGLVQVKKVDGVDYTKTVEKFKDAIRNALNSKSPSYIHHLGSRDQSRLVFLPFFCFNDKKLSPLSFELDLGVFDSVEFQKLLEAHRIELRHELVRDAERRKKVYEEWRDQDIESLNRTTQEAFELLLPGMGTWELASLAKEYTDTLLNETPEPLPDFWIALPPQVRSSLISGRTQRLRKFIEAKKVKHISSDSKWESLVNPLQIRDRQVRGMRNYEEATVGDSAGVLYISRQETLEWNLPNLIRTDNHYISEMEKLLNKFNETDPVREKKIDLINLSTLIDAFLRNWSPVFLPDQSAQNTYKIWCKRQRKKVWRKIHQALKSQRVRMEPLQVDNVIFSVHSNNSKRVHVTPFFLTTDKDYAILVDSRYGIPYYINSWQHREQFVQSANQSINKRTNCEAVCDDGLAAVETGNISEAAESFKQALRIHPALSTEIILERFWQSTCRDTHLDTKEQSELVEALNIFDVDRPKSIEKLTQFVKAYPNYLPDPYLLIGYDAVERSSSVPRTKVELDKLVKEFNDFIAEIKKIEEKHNEQAKEVFDLQEQYNQKIKELVAAEILVPTGANSYGINPNLVTYSIGSERVLIYGGQQSQYRTLPTDDLDELKKIQAKLEKASKPMQKLRNEIDKKAQKIEPLHRKIANLREKLTELRREVWGSLREHLNDHLIRSIALSPEHFSRICQEKMFFPSLAFAIHIAPLHDLLKGDEYLSIYSKIQQEIFSNKGNLIDKLKGVSPSEQGVILKKLIQIVEKCQKVKYLSEQEVNSLKDYQKLLEQFTSVDTLAREMMIRHRLEDILSNFVHQAYKLYDGVAPRVPEITEARQHLSIGQFLFCYYKRSYSTLVGGNTLPIKNGFPETQFTILDSKPLSILKVDINKDTKTIYIETPQGFVKPVIEFDQIGLEECQHLAHEFARQGYVERLKASGLTPAYAILLTPIAIPNRTRHWRETITNLEIWFNRVFAYAGIPPSKSETVSTEQALNYFDKTAVVDRIYVDREKLRKRFLEEVDPDQKVTIVATP